ncbi:von Willebrand factor A domain-containing protein 5A-like [Pecten maximus]|uniref:von Willebrand factor A domain-containing protein 5A-like n=1 Tax=Pecten maximus TaxID=6579 RepID=UPI0014581E8C|nr:von Willebrand factor A domain-containing protein 5A-like [Pecten maximus]
MRCGLSCLNTGDIVPLKEVQNVALIGASLVHVDSNLQYVNETNKPIEANFTFPLDTCSAVYRFEAQIDGRLIIAECQEKAQARDTYDKAIQSGHTAVLLEEHQDTNDVFVCRIGNLPALQKALVKICYVSELPHDPSGALRFTLPTVLNPRYGVEHNTDPVDNRTDVICINPGSYAMSLDITVQSQQVISSIVSEKDQFKLSSANNEHVWKASVQFSPGTKVDHDITIMIKYADMHQPQAIVECGVKGQNGILNMDTLMLSFYPKIDPKFSTTVGEFIFIIDRSGSMAGSRIASARETLLLMIKSLPVGCLFNVYSFGDNFHILFERDSACSVEYNEENMMYAMDFVQKIEANMGGTEIAGPIKDMYSKPCLPGHPRQVILLTDGDVWNVGEVVSLVQRNNNTTRMFSVGIGEGASTALVKGLARAGKGRAEFVKGNDRLQTKVVSLLKSAMQSVVTNVQVDLELPPEVSGTIIPHVCPSIFSGEELIMYAVLNGSESMDTIYGNIILRGTFQNQTFEHKLAFEGHRQDQQLDTSLPVHRLAAKALIRELQDEESADNKTDNKNKILLASMASNVISKYTSFVGVDKNSKVQLPEQSFLQIKEVCYGMFGASGGGMPPPSHGVFGAKPVFQFGASRGMGAQTGGMFGAKPCGLQSGSFGSSSGFSGQSMQAPNLFNPTFGAQQQQQGQTPSSQSNMFGRLRTPTDKYVRR